MRILSLIHNLTLILFAIPLVTSTEAPPYDNDPDYDEGKYGGYPIQNYKSSDITAPRYNILQHSPKCDDQLFTFLSPRGYSGGVRRPHIVILDSKGALVWSGGWENQQIYNFMMQRYRGNDYITFWAGNDAIGGHGAGYYYMVILILLDKNHSENAMG